MADDSSVRVLERACQVLDCFSAEAPRLRIADIRRLTNLPATTVARIVKTLVVEELLQRDGDDYLVGLRVLVWTAPATAGSDLMASAGPVVEQLRDYTRETTGLYVRQGANRVVVVASLSTYSVVYRAQVGQILPLHTGAAGKVLMAYDPAALDAALRKGLTAFTPKTITKKSELREQLAEVRDQGWAYASEENEVGLNSIAVPVFGPTGHVVGALAVGGPSFRLTRDAAEAIATTMVDAGLTLSKRLGYTEAPGHSARTGQDAPAPR
jgi:IclR family acetate operon transcriptional repressor